MSKIVSICVTVRLSCVIAHRSKIGATRGAPNERQLNKEKKRKSQFLSITFWGFPFLEAGLL